MQGCISMVAADSFNNSNEMLETVFAKLDCYFRISKSDVQNCKNESDLIHLMEVNSEYAGKDPEEDYLMY